MTLTTLDIIVLVSYIVVIFGAATLLSRRASRNTEEFFISGRSLPWWMIGTSMVATTFAADTPLVVSGLIAQGGIFKNWMWWYWGIAAMATVFLFAKLWRRAGITTDAELIELRYDGKPAAGLRFYRAAWFGIFQNILIIAWVMKAMAKIVIVVMGWEGAPSVMGMDPEVLTVLTLFIIAVTYTTLSGLWGVIVTDLIQFALAMGGSIYLAVVSYRKLGCIAGITAGLADKGFDPGKILQIVPEPGNLLEANPFTEFILLILIVWWTTYSVDGGGYLAQRMFAAKDERHSVLGYLWFCIAHTALRPWPWIVVGLCAMAMFGTVDDPETYYPMMMKEMLPPGIFGLVIASFFAAFMSTIDTQLNWGSSLVVNDILRRFLWKNRSEKEYISAARLSILSLAVLGALASFAVKDISFAWKLVISVTAGIGSVYIARWYWWRVNAWSEISAMATAMMTTFILYIISGRPGMESAAWLKFPYSTSLTVLLSVSVWVSVTMLTDPVGEAHLLKFWKRVRPGGKGWTKISSKASLSEESNGSAISTAGMILSGLILVYGMLFGIGWMILGAKGKGTVAFLVALGSGLTLVYLLLKRNGDERLLSRVSRKEE